jgi:hypothetical protein
MSPAPNGYDNTEQHEIPDRNTQILVKEVINKAEHKILF